MTNRQVEKKTRPQTDRSGQNFLVFLLAIALFPSIITELKAWDTVRDIARSVIHALPALTEIEPAEKHCSAAFSDSRSRTGFFAEDAAVAAAIALPRSTEFTQSFYVPPYRLSIAFVPFLRGPPAAS